VVSYVGYVKILIQVKLTSPPEDILCFGSRWRVRCSFV